MTAARDAPPTARREQMRARYPDVDRRRRARRRPGRLRGATARASRPILLMPTWSIVHSRHWKVQIPYLARRHRVVTLRRPRQRPLGPPDRPRRRTRRRARAANLAVHGRDAATERAVLVGLSRGAPGRCSCSPPSIPSGSLGLVFIGPAVAVRRARPVRAQVAVRRPAGETTTAGGSTTVHYWRRDYADFLEFFFARGFSEPHSTKQIEDTVGWGLETDAETLVRHAAGAAALDLETVDARCCRAIGCPILVIQGTRRPDHRRQPGDRPRWRDPGSAPRDCSTGAATSRCPRPGPGQPAAPRLRRSAWATG